MTLPPHEPSSPTRPPVDHYYFTIRDPNKETLSFFTHGFGHMFAACRWINTILKIPDIDTNWQSSDSLIITHRNKHTLTIRGSFLEDAVEYKLNKEEKEWTIPDTKAIRTLINFHQLSTLQPKEPEEPKPIKQPKPPKRHQSQKSVPAHMISIAQIAETMNLAPNKARNILRKNNIQKPPNGWTYKKNDPALVGIKKLLSDG